MSDKNKRKEVLTLKNSTKIQAEQKKNLYFLTKAK